MERMEMCETFWKEKRSGFVITQRRFHSHHPERLFQYYVSSSDSYSQTKRFSSLSPEWTIPPKTNSTNRINYLTQNTANSFNTRNNPAHPPQSPLRHAENNSIRPSPTSLSPFRLLIQHCSSWSFVTWETLSLSSLSPPYPFYPNPEREQKSSPRNARAWVRYI